MTGFHFKKILVAYDGSELAEKALKAAIKLAVHDKKIELHILHVLKPLPIFDYIETGVENVKMLRREKADVMMKEIKESLYGMGNPIIVEIVEGHPEKKIVEYAEKHNCDLIVMGSRGLGGLKEAFLGSVSHYVVQHTRIPTFIIK
ncbi:universal stress protein [Paenibacillus filicis]|uniref:Universal stress protein n=1 Tax=Paenibacillus gyeongsangnamensis TaxID=3388067 RepID=A0ABT4QIQ7_9BACL|nr:universal stress protein [Paenibacillus filicis]MCZ8516733.1 universal stress protein [Paenibacillus filicis]